MSASQHNTFECPAGPHDPGQLVTSNQHPAMLSTMVGYHCRLWMDAASRHEPKESTADHGAHKHFKLHRCAHGNCSDWAPPVAWREEPNISIATWAACNCASMQLWPEASSEEEERFDPICFVPNWTLICCTMPRQSLSDLHIRSHTDMPWATAMQTQPFLDCRRSLKTLSMLPSWC